MISFVLIVHVFLIINKFLYETYVLFKRLFLKLLNSKIAPISRSQTARFRLDYNLEFRGMSSVLTFISLLLFPKKVEHRF